MADWESVIVWGTFEELTNKKDRNLGLKTIMSRTLPEISSEMVKFSAE
jgi:nitroimidazol reductase NimA-like FMN-containing flavoprotein (pyridoxamine 5'-phosphate oxidase superfamily)